MSFFFFLIPLCAQRHCRTGTGLGFLGPVSTISKKKNNSIQLCVFKQPTTGQGRDKAGTGSVLKRRPAQSHTFAAHSGKIYLGTGAFIT